MHLLTSSMFLPTLAAFLSLPSQSALLRSYLLVALTYWVSRGRPKLPIRDFFDNATMAPSPPTQPPESHSKAFSRGKLENPWLAIIQSCLHHTDEHLLKTQRTLMHYATVYPREAGNVVPGGVITGLDGEEFLDGTLFVRVAGCAMRERGWMREGERRGHGQERGMYSVMGLGWDQENL